MIYLLAFIGLVTLAVLLWKAFGPTATTMVRGGGATRTGRVVGPDDDPEFLWRMDRDNHRRQSGTDTPTDPES
ncbi:hypothetical protein [Rhodococcus xishaensis]|uniref:Uncharacterized protein n=1 Tax=Rhodococcus xishaensis TaxID=2487364 RepID=A0A438AR57_9NOCA|nr:hypothetical protein [Rhodococcus xishaensis]RVW01162.1 hypothetical protein EGT50_12945 [Rhodococcus xishaensis]